MTAALATALTLAQLCASLTCNFPRNTIRYVKVDSCTRNCTPAAIGTTNVSQCGEILWSRYTRALNATGVPVVYSIVCNCAPQGKDRPWLWAKPFANSWRTNIDVQIGFQSIGSIIDCQRRMSSANGSWCPANPKDPEGRGEPCGGHGGPEQYSVSSPLQLQACPPKGRHPYPHYHCGPPPQLPPPPSP